MQTPETKPAKLKLGAGSRKPVKIYADTLVKIHFSSQPIPLIIEPAIAEVNLLTWAANNREIIKTWLLQHKALLFRNFNVTSTAEFDQFIGLTSNGELLEYRDRSSPRHEVGNKIYTSTDYPPEQSIFLHNEGTYWQTYPLKIYFCCLIVAQQGGETPIADSEKILQRLDPQICDRFLEKQVMYVRNYNDGFGLPWQTVFQTNDQAVVEEYCSKNAIEFEWKLGDRLRTRQIRPAIAQHPITGAKLWFNHAAFFHISTLPVCIRQALLSEFTEAELPHNTYYGDGSPIELCVLDKIRRAYHQETVVFPWQVGDILLLDNMSISHGRNPFVGSRKVVVGMAEPYNQRYSTSIDSKQH